MKELAWLSQQLDNANTNEGVCSLTWRIESNEKLNNNNNNNNNNDDKNK
jgi:hypothetical protein